MRFWGTNVFWSINLFPSSSDLFFSIVLQLFSRWYAVWNGSIVLCWSYVEIFEILSDIFQFFSVFIDLLIAMICLKISRFFYLNDQSIFLLLPLIFWYWSFAVSVFLWPFYLKHVFIAIIYWSQRSFQRLYAVWNGGILQCWSYVDIFEILRTLSCASITNKSRWDMSNWTQIIMN